MNPEPIQILWVDDEVDLLKPHILFLLDKGYQITPCNNGLDAIDLVQQSHFEAVLLDENMPGLSGLETLSQIKSKQPELPVIMVTKNEEEHIMEDAIGSKISSFIFFHCLTCNSVCFYKIIRKRLPLIYIFNF